jgi:hypothetical protein
MAFTVLIQESIENFAPQDDGPIPWVQILEYGTGICFTKYASQVPLT